jgi:peptidoglycan/xylan/chitin deacetylase (PgdA/CDA1 family)
MRLPSDPFLLTVTPEHFAEHLDVLRKHYRPMRLDRLVEAWRAGRLPRRAVAVTMDDGYFDALQYARPLLERYDVPATVFVVSGRVGDDRGFWWDELEALLLEPGELPGSLRLRVNQQEHIWEFGESAHYSAADSELHRGWHYELATTPTRRHAILDSIWRLLRCVPEEERSALMDDLFSSAGIVRKARPTHRTLTADEVERLGAGGLVEIGAHTVTHSVLSSLSGVEQQREIEQSKAELERMTGTPIVSFAYPHGQQSDYTAESAALASSAGFTSACAAYVGKVRRNTDRFQLPRNWMPDGDGEAFERRLAKRYAGR